MYELTVETHFDAAHCLSGYKGKCSRIHGHTWLVSATVQTSSLDDVGMSVDFKIIRQALESIVAEFDHNVLNDIEPFRDINPTAENLAKTVFDRMAEAIDSDRARVASVTVGEGTRNRLTYRP